jgi:uncharacterized protein YbdZ (MbtH family)
VQQIAVRVWKRNMKIRLDSGRHHGMKRASIFLITVALVAAMAGCVAIQYNVTFSSTAGGSVTAPGEGIFTYVFCTEVSLVATPDSGYQFVNWTGDVQAIADVNSASTIITSVQGDYSIRANFEQIPAGLFGLTTSSTDGGSVTLPGEGTFLYFAGTEASLVATPNSGYRFVNWTGDVATIANVNSASATITMNGHYSITAHFARIPPDQLGLTTSSTAGGSVTTPGEGTFFYDAGTVVNLVATPDSGYYFVNWTGDVATIANVNSTSTSITMEGSYSIMANFEQIPAGQFGLTTSSTAGGSVTTPGEGTFTYDAGTVASLVATPDSGYHFVNWIGDVATIANVNSASTTIAMEGHYSITANFEQIPAGQFSLTTSSTAGGAVTVPGEGTFIYDAGTVVNLVATPDSGYHFVNWTGDVATIANVNSASATITMEGSYSITANFDAIAPGLAVGLTGYPVNKLAVLAPWIALAAAIVAGAGLLVLRRRTICR